jgi:hypothetical protein
MEPPEPTSEGEEEKGGKERHVGASFTLFMYRGMIAVALRLSVLLEELEVTYLSTTDTSTRRASAPQ